LSLAALIGTTEYILRSIGFASLILGASGNSKLCISYHPAKFIFGTLSASVILSHCRFNDAHPATALIGSQAVKHFPHFGTQPQ
jgi:hypothetical protein